jgi:hypothetical protein
MSEHTRRITVEEAIKILQSYPQEAVLVTVCGESSFKPVRLVRFVAQAQRLGRMVYDDNGDVKGPIVTLDWR